MDVDVDVVAGNGQVVDHLDQVGNLGKKLFNENETGESRLLKVARAIDKLIRIS